MSSQHRSPVDVLVVLVKDNKILMTKRAGDAPGSGLWAIPSGGVEAGEDVVSTVRRELREELGLLVKGSDVAPLGVTHARAPDGQARVGFSFVLKTWIGAPQILEPDLCSELRWCAPEELSTLMPAVMPYTLEVVRMWLEGDVFSLIGWEKASAP